MKTIVVMPAYYAEKTLKKTLNDIPPGAVSGVILVDDGSRDATARVARSLGLDVIVHPRNRGYGAAQKTGYSKALSLGADLVALIHPDHQYDPSALPVMIAAVSSGSRAHVCLGSRMSLPGEALRSGMPLYRYLANRILSSFANSALRLNLSEYHTGFRVYRADFLASIGFENFSDDFIFDFQIIFKAALCGFGIVESPVGYRCTPESSSISFSRGVAYSAGVIRLLLAHRLSKVPAHLSRLDPPPPT
ncbi:MAG: glycosyltransferase family 2 protein [bacterium]